MSRRHSAEKREINPDPKYGNLVVSKFMNSIMRAGKKSVAESIVYGAFEIIEGKTKQNPVSIFEQALDNVMPSIEVRSRRVGGLDGPAFQEAERNGQGIVDRDVIAKVNRHGKGPDAQTGLRRLHCTQDE